MADATRPGNERHTQTIPPPQFISLQTTNAQIILTVTRGAQPGVLYWGQPLSNTEPEEIAILSTRQAVHGGPMTDLPASFSNELGAGLSGPPGFIAHRNGQDWAAIFRVTTVIQENETKAIVICNDENTKLQCQYDFELNPESHVLSVSTRIENMGADDIIIDWCAALCMPLDPSFSRLKSFTGRWAMEFQTETIETFTGSYLRENKAGRTSHDTFPGLIALTEHSNEDSGKVAGFHLGWSGNHRSRVDRHTDGRSFLQMGELFFPGEMRLCPGEAYQTPPFYAAYTDQGLSRLSQMFHTHVNAAILDKRTKDRARPVHYNTWEAIYFDHSEEKLKKLAKKAAAIGVERFVLDDGWFGARRNDKSGLGDWYTAAELYPNGLCDLADYVRSLGMEFGLWFEPEMVNPDSDLYRAHPDWTLAAPGVDHIPARNQLPLDLTRREVCDYLFERMHDLISTCAIAYIKWDMNRDIQHPASQGHSAAHRQTHAVYKLMQRLRDAHPDLEIESCASGGGRADFGILRHTDRLWLSDSNDALDRQSIQHGGSSFFPLSVLGSHVGPEKCHITHRRLNMDMRAGTAIFGHMGLELNLFNESEADLATLGAAVSLYKKHRQLIHGGNFVRIDSPDYLNIVGVIAEDRTEAMFACAKLSGHTSTLPQRIRFSGLDREKEYLTRIIWPMSDIAITTPSIIDIASLTGDGHVFSGEALSVHGIQLPLMHPGTCMIFHFQER